MVGAVWSGGVHTHQRQQTTQTHETRRAAELTDSQQQHTFAALRRRSTDWLVQRQPPRRTSAVCSTASVHGVELRSHQQHAAVRPTAEHAWTATVCGHPRHTSAPVSLHVYMANGTRSEHTRTPSSDVIGRAAEVHDTNSSGRACCGVCSVVGHRVARRIRCADSGAVAKSGRKCWLVLDTLTVFRQRLSHGRHSSDAPTGKLVARHTHSSFMDTVSPGRAALVRGAAKSRFGHHHLASEISARVTLRARSV